MNKIYVLMCEMGHYDAFTEFEVFSTTDKAVVDEIYDIVIKPLDKFNRLHSRKRNLYHYKMMIGDMEIRGTNHSLPSFEIREFNNITQVPDEFTCTIEMVD